MWHIGSSLEARRQAAGTLTVSGANSGCSYAHRSGRLRASGSAKTCAATPAGCACFCCDSSATGGCAIAAKGRGSCRNPADSASAATRNSQAGSSATGLYNSAFARTNFAVDSGPKRPKHDFSRHSTSSEKAYALF